MATSNEKPKAAEKAPASSTNFIRDIIDADLAAGRTQRVVTRFPPEPNGYLHIGHAKSICLNFGLARDYGGVCHLRFDDTNPTTEDLEYVESIQGDVRWLGFDWKDKLFFASDYYERLYAFAEQLIVAGKAYVCSLSEEEIRKYRGTAFEPGTPSPYRDRSVSENLDLFRRMRKGEFADGAHVLRAKIDMANANLKMRDWALYRIRHEHHYRTCDTWCLYPLYDFAHCLSDLIEGITHSICTLEFENNRELYDWIVDAVLATSPIQGTAHKPPATPSARPHQYEFARLNLTYTMMSKRKLLELVEGKHVSGWDDPRMPTIAGLRRRGYPAEAIREFCDRIGIAKNNSTVDVSLLEHVVREDLNQKAPRVLAVLRPLKVTLENIPEGSEEMFDAPYFPADVPRAGSRPLPLSRVIYIERDDFLVDPPKDYYRLAPGREVRLRHAHVIRCTGVVKDEQTGEVTELLATVERGPSGNKKVKGTIHWVSAAHAIEAEVRLYDRLFTTEAPGSTGDLMSEINPSSLVVLRGCRLEPSLLAAKGGDRFQFERLGFFHVDPIDSKEGAPVFNRTVALKDTWAKLSKADAEAASTPTPISSPPGSPKPAPAPHASTPRTDAAPLSARATQLRDQHGLPVEDARILSADAALRTFFDQALTVSVDPRAVAKWVVNEVGRELKGKGTLPFTGAAVGELAALVAAGKISGKIAKDVFGELVKNGGSPTEIVARLGLTQISDTSTIEAAVDTVLAENADAVARYRAGNENLLGAFVGMAMKKTGGKANPKLLNELLKKKLS